MDFTYPVAFVEGALLSLVASLIVVLTLKRLPATLALVFVAAISVFAMASLVNWGAIGKASPSFVIFDLIAIAFAAGLGAVMGMAPASLLLRRAKKADGGP
jgi:hypothetical protein